VRIWRRLSIGPTRFWGPGLGMGSGAESVDEHGQRRASGGSSEEASMAFDKVSGRANGWISVHGRSNTLCTARCCVYTRTDSGFTVHQRAEAVGTIALASYARVGRGDGAS
jgi:hypothetical protein